MYRSRSPIKIHASNRQKKNLDGIHEVLPSGSTVGKISPTTSIIKEPSKPEVRVRNSDIPKFETINERETELAHYADRRPPKNSEKTLEQNIKNHKKDFLRKDLGSKKMKRSRKKPDDLRVISSGRSCISATSNVVGVLKMRISKGNPKHNDAFKNRPDLTQILNFRSAEPIAAPPLQPYSSSPSTPQITPITPTVLPGSKTQKRKANCSGQRFVWFGNILN